MPFLFGLYAGRQLPEVISCRNEPQENELYESQLGKPEDQPLPSCAVCRRKKDQFVIVFPTSAF